MARSHKPLVWLPFAAGGMFAAFVTPIVILLTTGLIFPSGLDYERAHAFAANWIGKLILLGVILLPLWHAAHRLRITVHDFGIRADGPISWICYVGAAIATIVTVILLLSI